MTIPITQGLFTTYQVTKLLQEKLDFESHTEGQPEIFNAAKYSTTLITRILGSVECRECLNASAFRFRQLRH